MADTTAIQHRNPNNGPAIVAGASFGVGTAAAPALAIAALSSACSVTMSPHQYAALLQQLAEIHHIRKRVACLVQGEALQRA